MIVKLIGISLIILGIYIVLILIKSMKQVDILIKYKDKIQRIKNELDKKDIYVEEAIIKLNNKRPILLEEIYMKKILINNDIIYRGGIRCINSGLLEGNDIFKNNRYGNINNIQTGSYNSIAQVVWDILNIVKNVILVYSKENVKGNNVDIYM